MEEVVTTTSFWDGKKVFVTGHTGFKGAWLTLWLASLGARVTGYALEPDTQPSLFEQLGLSHEIDHCIADVRDLATLYQHVDRIRPDVVFHMAAQPLVRRSYAEPILTWQTNVMGTANLLDALRDADHLCAVVVVTTDKVYENRESIKPYLETDRLGGHDPYSSSKAASELAVDSWRNSFFLGSSSVRIATARAGNVIGGGDWAKDRIVPDMVRAIATGLPLVVRNPDSIRPWQHVLDPLSGYMRLAERLFACSDPCYQSAFNFGPASSEARTVRDLVDHAFSVWPGNVAAAPDRSTHHEARLLTLDNTKAKNVLGWEPTWAFEKAVHASVAWYRDALSSNGVRQLTLADIQEFTENARKHLGHHDS